MSYGRERRSVNNCGLPIKCAIPDGFLDERCLDGFVVSRKLKQIWAIESDLYLEFARICKKHGIRYQVFAGTLLGAIRHKGFIPWDDDFDVALERREFERFVKVAPSELEYPYFLQTALSDRMFFLGYARLRNSETTGAISGNVDIRYNNGIYLDIYVLDGKAKTKLQNIVQVVLRALAVKLLVASSSRKFDGAIKTFVYSILRVFAVLIPYHVRYSFYCWTLSLYNNTSDVLTQNTHGDWSYRYCVPKKSWDRVVSTEFLWYKVPISEDFDNVLKRIYGDYMTPPSNKDRGKWHEGQIYFEPNIPYKEYLKNK